MAQKTAFLRLRVSLFGRVTNVLPQRSYTCQLASRLAVLCTYEVELGNGWEDPDVHSDPESKRLDALKMGANIAVWALSH